MKKLYSLFVFLLSFYWSNAQQPAQTPDDNNNNQRVEVIKMAYMSRELNLTPQEAQNFWPTYNNYMNEIKQARSQYPNDELKYDQKVVDIRQRYQESFKKVLGNNEQRLNKVYTTDRQFRQILRNEQMQRQQRRQMQQTSGGMNKMRGNAGRKPF